MTCSLYECKCKEQHVPTYKSLGVEKKNNMTQSYNITIQNLRINTIFEHI